ncbi:Hsp90 domain containing protein [Tylopilus felleus]
MSAFGPPPLPLGWTEHVGPGGQPYYYHAASQQSTYIRPLPAFPVIPPPAAAQPPKKKKEKPLVKKPIPGTEWLRVTTTEGNIFYTHKGRKESVWVVPEEVKDALLELERAEVLEGEQAKLEQDEQEAEAAKMEREMEEEVDRIKTEVQVLVKRKKSDEPEPLDEVVITKKVRLEEEDDGQEEEVGEEGEEEGEESEAEEDWQKEAAAQLAAEAEEEQKRREEEAQRVKEAEEAEAKKAQETQPLNMPDRVDLSLDEAKALFKTLLREKDINPLHPWDASLPLFISDPRYVLLPSVSARRDAFDEYCRDRARELRQENVKKERIQANPKEEFDALLHEQVKSTRTIWSDFRRAWKKDRRFYGWGRDDREREKRFKDYLKELGEKKRATAEKAEAEFFALLREGGFVKSDSVWKDIKHKLSDDPRYDAVGSSTLREELFNAFLKARGPSDSKSHQDEIDKPRSRTPTDETENDRKHHEKRQRALKEREERVRVQRGRTEAEIGRSRSGLTKEEGERVFRTLLTDAIRDPQLSWDAVLPQLATDPRFTNSPLPKDQQLHLFHSHMHQLRSKYLNSLHALFGAHAPSLAASFPQLPLESIEKSLPATKLGFDSRELEKEFDKWQRERTSDARKAFDEMLSENAFVEFWGRLGKIGGEGVDGGVAAEELGEDEGEGFGGKVDMKVLAKNVDLEDIINVLKNDKRYILFEHVPDQRERWIRVCYFSSLSQDASDTPRAKHEYQSDVARLRRIVINRDVFLRELISNANDALEKFRLTALTEKDIYDGVSPLNVTIKAVKNEDDNGGRIIITDTGIGMSAEELTSNLGTLAKSGTSEFLDQAGSMDTTNSGNLIGAFGVGFYSSFLVADKVTVASIPPKSSKHPNPSQNVFSSSADEGTFEVYPDPRGNSLGHGTEITLELKPDAKQYLIPSNLMNLINKHSAFSTSFPIYLWNEVEQEVPIEEEEEIPQSDPETKDNGEEAVVEEEKQADPDTPKTKTVMVGLWEHMNSQPPLWMRDPKTVTDEEYGLLYQATFKDFQKPLTWTHFAGDSGDVSFRALIYVPSRLPNDFLNKPVDASTNDVKLLVKHVFITSDLGEYALPKWASWVKVIIDAEDLPLNVSRETLQSSEFLRQIKNLIIRRLLLLFGKVTEEDPEKFHEITNIYNTVLKLGGADDNRNRERISALTRYATNQRNVTSFDDYVTNKKQGQNQIFYLADMGKSIEHLAGSVFVEKLHARGYEVFLMNEPLDEILIHSLQSWKGMRFQDVAKAGLKFGDDSEEEEESIAALTEKFAPLLSWLKVQVGDNARDVVISDRLVTSPCAIVADSMGVTANVQRLLSATSRGNNDVMQEMMRKQKVLEVNPRSPLIEGLLYRVQQLEVDSVMDEDLAAELEEVAAILIDGALVRSGFDVADSNLFLTRVDRVLRRSLGVSETAPTDTTVKPAPPVDPTLAEEVLRNLEDAKTWDEFVSDEGFRFEVKPVAFSRLQLAAALLEYDNDPDDPDAPYRSAHESAVFAHLRRNLPLNKSRRTTDYLGVQVPSEVGSDPANRRPRAPIDALHNPFGNADDEDEPAYENDVEVDLTSWGLDAFMKKNKAKGKGKGKAKSEILPNPHVGDSVRTTHSVAGDTPDRKIRSMSVGTLNDFGAGGVFLDADSGPDSLGRIRSSADLDQLQPPQPPLQRRRASAHVLIETLPVQPPLHSVPFPSVSVSGRSSPGPEEILRPGSRSSRLDLQTTHARTQSNGSLGSKALLNDILDDEDANPFAVQPPSPDRASRFDPKANRGRTMSSGSIADDNAFSTHGRTMSVNSMGTRMLLENDADAESRQLLRPKVLSTPVTRAHSGFQISTDGPPLPPAARSSRLGIPVASNSLSLSQLAFRNTDIAYSDIDRHFPPYFEIEEEESPVPSSIPLPPIRRPAGKLYGRSLIDNLEHRKLEMKQKARTFRGDDRPSMMVRGQMRHSLASRRNSTARPLLDSSGKKPPIIGTSRSVFGKLKEIEAQEQAELEERRRREQEDAERRQRKKKRRSKLKETESTSPQMEAGPQDPPMLPAIQKPILKRAPIADGEPSESENDEDDIPLGQSIGRITDKAADDWVAESSDEDERPRHTTGSGPHYSGSSAPLARPRPNGVEDEDSEEDLPLTAAAERITKRATQLPSARFLDEDDEDTPLAAVLSESKLSLGQSKLSLPNLSFDHLSGERLSANDDDEDEQPLGLRASRLPPMASHGPLPFNGADGADEDEDRPLAFHPEQQRKTQYQMLAQLQQQQQQQQQQQMMMQAQMHNSLYFGNPAMMGSGFFGQPVGMGVPPFMGMPMPPSPPPVHDPAKYGRVDRWRHNVAVEGEQ